MFYRLIIGLLFIAHLSGCASNPVTGKSELALVSEQQELAIGKENYLPGRQMQGGDYITDPAVGEYVQEVGNKLVAVADRKLPYEFVVLNNSVPNAWALPGGKIAINRGLLVELENEAQLAAVLGHEIVHAAARHGAKSMQRGLLAQLAVVSLAVATQNKDYNQVAVLGSQVFAGLVTQKYGRDAESESDYYGMLYMKRAGYDPAAAVQLQEIFVKLSEGKSSSWLGGLFASHPPSLKRVEDNKRTLQKIQTGGDLGIERYQALMARLKRTQPAYKAHDEGIRALKQKENSKALKLAGQAIAGEPDEAMFYALKGDVLFMKRDYRQALRWYDQALERNDGYFGYYLKRGKTRQKLGDRQGARTDLETSIELLPTANANRLLGDLLWADGNTRSAYEYYKSAAESDMPDGIAARKKLVNIELQQDLQRYLKAELVQDSRGEVFVQLSNFSTVPIHEIRVDIRFVNQQGLRMNRRYEFNEVIPGRERRRFPLPESSREPLQYQGYQAEVVHASVYFED